MVKHPLNLFQSERPAYVVVHFPGACFIFIGIITTLSNSKPNPSQISLQEFLYDITKGIAVDIEVRGRIRSDRNTNSIDGMHRDVVNY
jgi:hypothetical protein